MNQRITIALSLLAGAVFGATAIQGLHAQAKPGALVVIDISDITDPEGFKGIINSPQTSPATLAAQGGHYVVRTDKAIAFDGTAPKRLVVLGFDSVEKAQAWNNSAPQAPINALRAKTTKSRAFVVESVGN
jgi:uncharacterized protein (DUF1330 family)